MTAELLVLVPQSYPFGSLTDFLEDEIAHLAEAFRSVLIAPVSPEGDEQPVPSNCTVDLALAPRIRSRRQRVLAALRAAHGRRLLGADLRTESSPRRHLEALARLAAASGVASETARWARTLGRLPDSTLGMTVWLGGSTIGLRKAGLRTVSRVHGGELFAVRARHGYQPLQRQALLACEKVMSVSDAGRDDLRRRFPEVADRCETRRLGIGGAKGLAVASTDGVLRVVSCAALRPVKRPLLLVEVVRELAGSGVEIEWHHFGSGPLEDQVREGVSRFPDSARAVLHGQVENAVVLRHYTERPVDVLVNVSSSEGVPVSMMEAASAGIPMVATDVGGVREIVDETTGTLVASDAPPAAIAQAIVEQVGRDDECRRAAIRARWSQRYSARRNYAALATDLADLAQGRTS